MGNTKKEANKRKKKDLIVLCCMVIFCCVFLIIKMLAANFGYNDFTWEQLFSRENIVETINVACIIFPIVGIYIVVRFLIEKRIGNKK